MGGAMAGSDPWSLTLDTAAPQGNTCYAIMVRFDNNETTRSLYPSSRQGRGGVDPDAAGARPDVGRTSSSTDSGT